MSALPWVFTVGFVVSFLGTLPLGVLNITIIRVSLRQGVRAGLEFALACALVELVYSYLAVRITLLLIAVNTIRTVTEVISAAVLTLMGFYYLRKEATSQESDKQLTPFLLGSVLSIVNVVAFPFWIVYTTLLTDQGWLRLPGTGPVLVYVTGIALGTLLALALFARLSLLLRNRLAAYQHRFDRIIGLLFFVLSFLQTLTLFR